LELLKREVEMRYDFTPLAAFRSIDRYNVGRIDTINLGTFLRAQSHNPSEIEVLAIIRRFDTDGDACLDFNEFAEFMKSEGSPEARTV
jgi:Ca2+-binding EF-hand superfamily protein